MSGERPSALGSDPRARRRTVATLLLGAAGFAWAIWFIGGRLAATLLFALGVLVGVVGAVGAIAARKRGRTGWLVVTAVTIVVGIAVGAIGAVGMVQG